jgi:hypothetical protein
MLKLITKTLQFLSIAAIVLAMPVMAQEADRYVPVKAPYAQNLVHTLMAAHPDMEFIGIHVTPPARRII